MRKASIAHGHLAGSARPRTCQLLEEPIYISKRIRTNESHLGFLLYVLSITPFYGHLAVPRGRMSSTSTRESASPLTPDFSTHPTDPLAVVGSGLCWRPGRTRRSLLASGGTYGEHQSSPSSMTASSGISFLRRCRRPHFGARDSERHLRGDCAEEHGVLKVFTPDAVWVEFGLPQNFAVFERWLPDLHDVDGDHGNGRGDLAEQLYW